MKFRFWMPLVAALALVLNGCGGGGGGGNGSVRLVNATTDYATLDFFADDTQLASGVAINAASDYSSLGEGSYAMVLKLGGTATTVSSTSRAITSDVNNTLVVYNTNGLVSSAYLTDNEEDPTAGTVRFRVFNATYEAGSLDVYVTTPTTDISTGTAPTVGNIASERASVYTDVAPGTYRLRVTGNGNPADIRLDMPITLADQEIVTLITTKTTGGVLVNGLLLDQGGAATALTNTTARVRVVAGASRAGLPETETRPVSATINGVAVATTLPSPNITAYSLVTAGALTTTIDISGTPVAAPAMSVAAGSDSTVLVLGTPAAPIITLINDVNIPSTNSSLPTRMRLLHAVNGQPDPLTLTADFAPIASNVPFASASSQANISAETTRLVVTSATVLNPLFSDSEVVLRSGGVYTLFMLGDAGAVQGALRLDR